MTVNLTWTHVHVIAHFRYETCAWQRCGEQPLREVLSCLLDNALKYCEPVEPLDFLGEAGLLCVSCDFDDTTRSVLVQIWNSAEPIEEESETLFEWGARGRCIELISIFLGVTMAEAESVV